MIKFHLYGMKNRVCSPGGQPYYGLVARRDDLSGKFKDIIIYNRELSNSEIKEFELEEINES